MFNKFYFMALWNPFLLYWIQFFRIPPPFQFIYIFMGSVLMVKIISNYIFVVIKKSLIMKCIQFNKSLFNKLYFSSLWNPFFYLTSN